MRADEVYDLALALPEVEALDHDGNAHLRVRGRAFGHLADVTVTVKALREEQGALVAADPAGYAAGPVSGRFGWVTVRLAAADSDELRELLTEAWRLSAPKRLTAALDH